MRKGFTVLAGVDNDPAAAHAHMHNLGAYPCEFHFVEERDRERMEKHLAKSFKAGNNGLISAQVAGGGWRACNQNASGVPHFFLGDIRKLAGRDILDSIRLEPDELDVVTGGPPCQGYSRGGNRHVMDPRNSLVFEFARLVCEMKPKTVVMENVPGIIDMMTPDGVLVLDAFCKILEDGGFGGLDAFRRTFRAQIGAVGLLKADKPKKPKSDKPDAGQFDLFEATA